MNKKYALYLIFLGIIGSLGTLIYFLKFSCGLSTVEVLVYAVSLILLSIGLHLRSRKPSFRTAIATIVIILGPGLAIGYAVLLANFSLYQC